MLIPTIHFVTNVARLYIILRASFLKRLHRIILRFRNVLYRKYLRKPYQSVQPLKNHEQVLTGRAAEAESPRHKFIMRVLQSSEEDDRRRANSNFTP